MIDLLTSVLRGGPRRWASVTGASLLALGMLVGTLNAGAPAPRSGPNATWSEPLETLSERVDRVGRAWAAADAYYEEEVAPIERVLLRYREDPELARRIAVALVREANRTNVEPRLLLAVLLVENPWLDPKIRSPVGAVGLMQVMPLHRGHWRECGDDLEDIDSNVCYGARIFANVFRISRGNIERALLRYNGCVRGTNTPNCNQYAYHVFARAGRASIMAWLSAAPGSGSR